MKPKITETDDIGVMRTSAYMATDYINQFLSNADIHYAAVITYLSTHEQRGGFGDIDKAVWHLYRLECLGDGIGDLRISKKEVVALGYLTDNVMIRAAMYESMMSLYPEAIDTLDKYAIWKYGKHITRQD